jgi:hypothetical protein
MIKFKSLPPNRVVMIECQAYAKNIERDSTSGLGIVNFEVKFCYLQVGQNQVFLKFFKICCKIINNYRKLPIFDQKNRILKL